jgi:hypothetical protein
MILFNILHVANKVMIFYCKNMLLYRMCKFARHGKMLSLSLALFLAIFVIFLYDLFIEIFTTFLTIMKRASLSYNF